VRRGKEFQNEFCKRKKGKRSLAKEKYERGMRVPNGVLRKEFWKKNKREKRANYQSLSR
jgi:hypothetical protein